VAILQVRVTILVAFLADGTGGRLLLTVDNIIPIVLKISNG
jgi:hypothetical protein